MSQADLSRELDTTPGNVNRWVKGEGVPSYELCRKLLILGMTVEELFGVTEYKVDQTNEFSSGRNAVFDSPSFKDGVYNALQELKKAGLI